MDSSVAPLRPGSLERTRGDSPEPRGPLPLCGAASRPSEPSVSPSFPVHDQRVCAQGPDRSGPEAPRGLGSRPRRHRPRERVFRSEPFHDRLPSPDGCIPGPLPRGGRSSRALRAGLLFEPRLPTVLMLPLEGEETGVTQLSPCCQTGAPSAKVHGLNAVRRSGSPPEPSDNNLSFTQP
jgi:hypothetical protein